MSNEAVRTINSVKELDIPENTIDRRFQMDPKTMDVIWGTKLQEGMIVLVEDSIMWGDPTRMENDYEFHKVLEVNRWCLVTELTSYRSILNFIGVYSDGTKRVRTYSNSYAWIVLKSSM